ncbi:MAG: nucleoside hydrolase [Bacteroidota bacterium]
MLSRFKQSFKRALVFILILAVIFIIVLTITTLTGDKLFSRKVATVLIDSDSGNEMDDLFAISRALIAPELKIVGLTSAHWEFAEDAGDSSLEVSQKLNEQLLALFGKLAIPHPRGANKALKFSPEPQPIPSPAAEFIIKKAHEMEKKKKLNVVTLGALTNVASAIMMDPEIIPKIRIYMMGLKYDPKTKIWNKNEFNTRNDLDAVDYLLNTHGLEMHIMTATTSEILVFDKEETLNYLNDKGKPWEFLVSRWNEKYPAYDEWIMWDLAIIEALIDPELARQEETLTPPENKQRTVNVYTYINKELMIADFYSKVMKFQREE